MEPVLYKGWDACSCCGFVRADYMVPDGGVYCGPCLQFRGQDTTYVPKSEPLFPVEIKYDQLGEFLPRAVLVDHPEPGEFLPRAVAAERRIQHGLFLPVLDHGFVEVVDLMGDDSSIVQAARVSTGQGIKTPEQDAKLISYLMENGHTSPFEAVTIKVHVKAPIFVARQWMRHRTWSYNEISARYTELPEEFYVPKIDSLREQSQTNRQGGGKTLAPAQAHGARLFLNETYEKSYLAYKTLLELGVSREQARMVLPVGLYTEFYGTVNLHNLFHFLKLRLDPHAQWEIRQYAEALLTIARDIAPVATEAFDKYVLQKV